MCVPVQVTASLVSSRRQRLPLKLLVSPTSPDETPRPYKYVCIGRSPDSQGWGKTPETNQRSSELKTSPGKLRLREGGGLPAVTAQSELWLPFQCSFRQPPWGLALGPASSLEMLQHVCLWVPIPWSLWKSQIMEPCIFKVGNELQGLVQPPFSSLGPPTFAQSWPPHPNGYYPFWF